MNQFDDQNLSTENSIDRIALQETQHFDVRGIPCESDALRKTNQRVERHHEIIFLRFIFILYIHESVCVRSLRYERTVVTHSIWQTKVRSCDNFGRSQLPNLVFFAPILAFSMIDIEPKTAALKTMTSIIIARDWIVL